MKYDVSETIRDITKHSELLYLVPCLADLLSLSVVCLATCYYGSHNNLKQSL